MKKAKSAASIAPRATRTTSPRAQLTKSSTAATTLAHSGSGRLSLRESAMDTAVSRLRETPNMLDLQEILTHFALCDEAWMADFARGDAMAVLGTISHHAGHPTRMQACALQILRLAMLRPDVTGIALAQEYMLNHVWWGLRRAAPSDGMVFVALEALTSLVRIDRERGLAALRFVKKQCRTTALLERVAELVASPAPTVALAAMSFLLCYDAAAPSAEQRAGIRRELLLLDVASAARQQVARGHLLSNAAQALLKLLRAGTVAAQTSASGASPSVAVTVLADDQESIMAMPRKTTLLELVRKLLKGREDEFGVLVHGSAPQSAVWAAADLGLAQLEATGVLRCDLTPLPLHVRVEGPTMTEADCPLDPRLDAARALEYLAVLHYADGQPAPGVRLKVAGGPWLSSKARLGSVMQSGVTLQLLAPPTDVLVEQLVDDDVREHRVPLRLGCTVAELMVEVHKNHPEDTGMWMREVGRRAEDAQKLWMESERSLASYGIQDHVLRLEVRPRTITLALPSGRQRQLTVVFADTPDTVLQKVCAGPPALDVAAHRLAVAGADHFLFPWASLFKQGIHSDALIEVRALAPDWDWIWQAAAQPPLLRDDPRREVDIHHDDKGELEAASLNALVTHVTGPAASVKVTQMLLHTLRSFTDAPTLLRLLIQRAREAADDKVGPVRVGTVLKQWLDVDTSLEGVVVNNLALFVERDLTPKAPLTVTLQNALLRWIRGDVKRYQVTASPPSPVVGRGALRRYRDIAPVEIARQLTLAMFDQYARIEAREFFKQPWAKEKTQHLCPNIMALIASYNTLACRVASSVVRADTVRRRVKMIVHHLSACVELRALQNYHALSAYVSGLGNAAVIRLKHTKEALPKKWLKVWDDIAELTNMKSSFGNLRGALMHGDPPKIPYLGVYLSDFTFIEDGNLDTVVRNDVELIHVTKRALAYRILSTIQQWQGIPYNLVRVPRVQELLAAQEALDDKTLYAESLAREPRET